MARKPKKAQKWAKEPASRPIVLGWAARKLKIRGKGGKEGRVKPKAVETPDSNAIGGVPFSPTVTPPPVHATPVEHAGFEAHLLEISPQPSVTITAAAYAGLRGRTIPAEFLRVQPVEVPIEWASQVKEGHAY